MRRWFCAAAVVRFERPLMVGLTLFAGLPGATPAAEPLWRQLMPRKNVDADPRGDYTLGETNGPWLIMAASFTGEEGEGDARKLVLELRQRFNLPAYYYAMTFKLDDGRVGRGLDDYGGPVRRRYARGNQVLEHAVLVGEFLAVDDADGQALLERVKTIEPDVLKGEGAESTSQSLASVRQFYRATKQRLGQAVTEGPMSHAFITRNPLLPKEYFTPGIDPDVVKWNEGLEHSALHCPEKYTIKVATFRGRTTLQKAEDVDDQTPRTRLASEKDPLVIAGQDAHRLVVALRSLGWEAFEFHDRHESYVAVGSFAEMQQLDDGRLLPATRDAQIIMSTFGASTPNVGFERPNYDKLGLDAAEIRKFEADQARIKQQFANHLAAGLGEAAEGFHPKRLMGMPFDIQPTPIVAPKPSIGAAYARR